MVPADLPSCEAIGDAVHAGHPEDEGRMAEKFRLFPAGCFVRRDGGATVGYAIAHPWRSGDAVALNASLGALPADADTLYVHDLALLPAARGKGAGRAGVERLAVLARDLGYASLSLIAVGGTGPFWRRAGFGVILVPALDGVLRSYDEDAAYMRRAAPGADPTAPAGQSSGWGGAPGRVASRADCSM